MNNSLLSDSVVLFQPVLQVAGVAFFSVGIMHCHTCRLCVSCLQSSVVAHQPVVSNFAC